MIYNIDSEIEFSFDFDYPKVYEDVVSCVLDHFNCEYDCEVSLILTDNDSIREINRDTRGIDKATDVLSFPNIEYKKAGDFTLIDETEDYFEPETGELILGDIVLSVDRVLSQAEEYGHSVLREYSFLICHSMLHLCGFDHIDEDDRIIMEKYQTDIMEILNIKR